MMPRAKPQKKLPLPKLRLPKRLPLNEPDAVAALAAQRWPYGPECDRCGNGKGAKKLNAPQAWLCDACIGVFEVTDGTPLESMPQGLAVWLRIIAVGWCNRGYLGATGLDPNEYARKAGISHLTALTALHMLMQFAAWPSPENRAILKACGFTDQDYKTAIEDRDRFLRAIHAAEHAREKKMQATYQASVARRKATIEARAQKKGAASGKAGSAK